MFTLQDEHTIVEDATGKIFNKRSPLYLNYVNWCDSGNTPTIANQSIYEAIAGSYKGKTVYFCRKSTAGQQTAEANQSAANKVKRGALIKDLCQSVMAYFAAKADLDGYTAAEIDAMLSVHGTLLQLIQQNRYLQVKDYIQNVTPDQYITQADIDKNLEMFTLFESEIAKYA